MARVGLVVVDVQRALHEFNLLKQSVDAALMFAIVPALRLFRETKNPVFFVQHDGELTPEGSPGFELTPALARKENEYQIVKRHLNSFFKTNLKEKLDAEGVDFVVVCGLSAGYCVKATMQGAAENGFKAALLQHGVAASKESHIQADYETSSVISLDALKYFLS